MLLHWLFLLLKVLSPYCNHSGKSSGKKLNIELLHGLTIPLLVICAREVKNICSHKNLYMNVHSDIVHDSPKVETTQMPIDWWIDNHYVVYLHNRIWFGRKGIVLIHVWHGWTLKALCYVKEVKHTGPHFTWSVQNRQCLRDRKLISGCQGLDGRGNGAWLVIGTGFVWDDDILELVIKVAQLCEHAPNHWIVYFRRMNFMVYELHFNFTNSFSSDICLDYAFSSLEELLHPTTISLHPSYPSHLLSHLVCTSFQHNMDFT